ncbi:MAG: ABC transporter ATP-binding protein [Chloroflexota bacterium]
MASIMRGLDAEAYDRQYNDSELLKRILGYFRPHTKKLLLVFLSMLLISGANAGVPIIISNGIDQITTGGSDDQLSILIGIIFVIGSSVWGFNWVRRKLSVEVISDAVLAMRIDAFDSAARQDMSFYDEFNSGRIVSRITSDTQEFNEVMILVIDIFNQLAVAIILIIVLFRIQWQLTLLVMALAPVVALAAIGFRNWARRITKQSSRALGEVNKSIQEAVTGIRVAKNFRQEQAIYDAFKDINQQAYSINVRKGFVIANIFPTINTLSGIGTAVLVYYGGLNTISGAISIAAWFLFISTIDRFWFPITNMSAFWSQFQAGLSAIERVFALMDVETAVSQTDSQTIPHVQGQISFKEISFRYSEQEQILKNFNLDIKAGESIALVGHTGAGKSSIIKLIARFYDFQAGSIEIDGIPIETLELSAYRKQLGLVSQVPFLFDGTVADNMRYGRSNATDEELLTVAQSIGDGEWLDTLPNGLNSQVGERGSRLSMGQRQLVALTRVLIQNPAIFILDEATASVDPFTESQIQEALNLIMKERTSIIIAHRLSTITATDRIIVLQNGDIIESGSHKQLLEQQGHYAELYDTYFRHQSPKYNETVANWMK